MVKAEVHLYGERGLVNAILLDLNDAGRLLDLIGLIDFHARTPHRIVARTDAAHRRHRGGVRGIWLARRAPRGDGDRQA